MPSADQTSLKLLQRARPLLMAQRWGEAIPLLQKVLKLRPRDAVLWHMLAQAFGKADRPLDRLQAAEEAQRHAGSDDELARDATEEAVAAALAVHDPGRALALAEKLPVELRDQSSQVLCLMGQALNDLGRPTDAVATLMKALALKLDDPVAHTQLGFAFYALKLNAEAAECFRTVCTLYPGNVGALAYLNYLEQMAGRWDGYEDRCRSLLDSLAGPLQSKNYVSPFALVMLPHTAAQMLAAARLAADSQTRNIERLPAPELRLRAQRRLHVAYLSNDFHGHATATLITQVLECHDRERFEVSLLSHGSDDGSTLRQRLVQACDRFEDMSRLSLGDMARRVRELGVDILVELKGHTSGSRIAMLAYRPAPVQVAWLGFPGTCGVKEVDYIVGDAVVTPLADAPWYSEKIAQMPHCYQPNDGSRGRAEPPPRSELGLPEDALVLLSANQVAKLNPQLFDVWADILHRLPNAVLWQRTGGEAPDAELRREMQARGIAPERFIPMPRAGIAEHLRRLGAADLALDSWPCNGHTTTSDALWAGVPVVAVRGQSFAGRVSESLLCAVGLSELVCETPQAYADLVCELAGQPERRAQLRRRLGQARDDSPLYDAKGFAHDLEALYERMWARHEDGLPPAALPATQSEMESAR
jgi:tetratricopeptide (TPR) repeat protein